MGYADKYPSILQPFTVGEILGILPTATLPFGLSYVHEHKRVYVIVSGLLTPTADGQKVLHRPMALYLLQTLSSDAILELSPLTIVDVVQSRLYSLTKDEIHLQVPTCSGALDLSRRYFLDSVSDLLSSLTSSDPEKVPSLAEYTARVDWLLLDTTSPSPLISQLTRTRDVKSRAIQTLNEQLLRFRLFYRTHYPEEPVPARHPMLPDTVIMTC
jgi:hypothetical protein